MSNVQSELSSQREPLPELARLGLAYYDDKLKPLLEPQQNNKFVAIHVDSGDYAVEKSADDAVEAILTRHPIDGRVVVRIIGPKLEYGLSMRAYANKTLETTQK